MQDINANQQSDYLDFLGTMKESSEFQQVMSFDQQKEVIKQKISDDKMQLAREKMANDTKKEEIKLKIAQENKNKFDSKKKSSDKKK